MKPRVILLCSVVLFGSYSALIPVQAVSAPSGLDPNRVIVDFSNNTSTYAAYISSKYHVPKVLENDVLRFAEFVPSICGTIFAVKLTSKSV